MSDAIKYLTDGRACRVLTTLESGKLVVEMGFVEAREGDCVKAEYGEFENPDDVQFFGDTETVGRVFDSPPFEAKHREIAKLDRDIVERQQKQAALRVDVSKLEQQKREYDEVLRRLKGYPALEMIDAVMSKDCTHALVTSAVNYGNDDIRTAYVCEMSRYSSDRVATLEVWIGEYDKITWRLKVRTNDRHDNDWREAVPCRSLEEAQAKARAILTKSLEALEAGKYKTCGAREIQQVIPCCKALGMDIPASLPEVIERSTLHDAEQELREANRRASDALAKVELLRAAQGQSVTVNAA